MISPDHVLYYNFAISRPMKFPWTRSLYSCIVSTWTVLPVNAKMPSWTRSTCHLWTRVMILIGFCFPMVGMPKWGLGASLRRSGCRLHDGGGPGVHLVGGLVHHNLQNGPALLCPSAPHPLSSQMGIKAINTFRPFSTRQIFVAKPYPPFLGSRRRQKHDSPNLSEILGE